MANAKVLQKTQLLRLLVNELYDNIEAREAEVDELGYYPGFGYGKAENLAKTQIENDIRRCRRKLLDLWKLFGKQ